MVTFELFVRPAIRKMLGFLHPFRRTVQVVAEDSFAIRAPLTHFHRGIVRDDNGVFRARLTGPQGSGILTSMALANALIVIPQDIHKVEPGTHLRAIILDDPGHTELPTY